jgi:hypothetical protein
MIAETQAKGRHEMQLPNFTAEASIYQTKSHYRLIAGGSHQAYGSGNIFPQDCGLGKGLFCGFTLATTAAACVLLCLDGGPQACGVCLTAALGADYGGCKDCFPGWIRALLDIFEGGGGGGGGGGPPPPDCTTTGCRPPSVCCECVGPPICTTPARCKFLCTL